MDVWFLITSTFHDAALSLHFYDSFRHFINAISNWNFHFKPVIAQDRLLQLQMWWVTFVLQKSASLGKSVLCSGLYRDYWVLCFESKIGNKHTGIIAFTNTLSLVQLTFLTFLGALWLREEIYTFCCTKDPQRSYWL